MPFPSDETVRAALDAHGLLRPGALESPSPDEAFVVFAQGTDARVELLHWQQQIRRFFGARLGLTVDKVYVSEEAPAVDAANVVIAPKNLPAATRFLFARPRTPEDLLAVDAVERRTGAAGLGELARRCPYVWLVGAESSPDPHALLLAAVLASVMLGPIVSPNGAELFGVKTARAMLERLGVES